MKRTKWTEREFVFDLPAGWFPNVLERLRGVYARMAEMTLTLSEQEAAYQPGDKWSIKEHIGHLADLEELHEGRINDFILRKERLRAADMQNKKTYAAHHNRQDLPYLLRHFKHSRQRLIAKLEHLDDQTHLFQSIHPRLQKPVRPVDIAFFAAEHDDHHLASIREILIVFAKG